MTVNLQSYNKLMVELTVRGGKQWAPPYEVSNRRPNTEHFYHV